MIKLTQRTLNIIDLLIRHSFHYWIWTFCALFLIFDKILHMPLELLNHFNFIPEFIINLSKIINTKPIEATIPEINVIPANNEELIVVFKESIFLLQQEISLMSNKFDKLFALLQDNTVLLQNQLNFQKELFTMVENKIASLNVSTDLINISNKLQDMNAILQAQVESQVEMDIRIISQLKDTKTSLFTLNNNILDINKSILNLDFNKPLVSLNDVLNQIALNQNDFYSMYQNAQETNLQNINAILEAQQVSFNNIQENVNQVFSKVHEIRNHNLEVFRQLDKNIDFKLENMESKIVSQITDEINRPKTSSTSVSSNTSKLGFFNKKS